MESLDRKFSDEVSRLDKKINDIEQSQQFLSDEYQKNKIVMNNITNKNVKIEQENKLLHSELSKLTKELEQEKATRNEEAQYHRTSLNVRITGIPFQAGEDDITDTNNKETLSIIQKVSTISKIQNFDIKHVDVCHRVGYSKYSPIIIRFKTKDKRMNFFKQRKNLRKFHHRRLRFHKRRSKRRRQQKAEVESCCKQSFRSNAGVINIVQ